MNEIIKYAKHFLERPQILIFFLLSFLTLIIMYILIYIYVNLISVGTHKYERKEYFRRNFYSITERFYAIIFSGTSILFFMASYYLIERFFDIEPYKSLWNKYRDFWLLLLIILSCVFNSIMDTVLVRLKHLSHEDKASCRLTGMGYMILIFFYIKFIYENNNYDVFITYFLGLMVGRFVYFDASFRDFLKSIVAAIKNIPLMLIGLLYTGIMCYYGFNSGYLVKHIGVITDTFIAHFFMCASIFILHHSHLSDLIVRLMTKNKGYRE